MHGGPGESTTRAVSDQRPPQRITARTGLPSGRAVVGALLVAVSVVALFASYRQAQSPPTTSFVVAARTIAAGHRITTADLAVRTVSLPDDIATRTVADPELAVGAVAVETLHAGQFLHVDALVAITDAADDRFEVSLALPRSRAVDGRLGPGEPVDVVATIDTDGTSCTSVVVDDARVVATSGTDTDLVTGRGGTVTVTLAIDDPDAVLAAVFAADEADITLIRATAAQARPIDGAYCAPGRPAEAP
jgi:Flp pilus assembly protein CpaB